MSKKLLFYVKLFFCQRNYCFTFIYLKMEGNQLKNCVNYIGLIAWELFFDTESESENEEKRVVAKNKNYYEIIIPSYDDKTFKSHFRLERTNFEILFSLIHEEHGIFSDLHSGRPQIDLEKQILITLWFLANTECFRSVADRFGVCKKTCWTIVDNICNLFLKINVRHRIIAWPTPQDVRRTASHYQETTRFPGIIGCIDGSHIPIATPKIHPNSYVNRKKFHSILLQVVCDENKLFLDCYAGEAGSVHDACLFRRSNLFRKITSGTISIPDDHHILGDRAYGLKPYLLTRFKDHGNLNVQQKKYNKVHSNIRAIVERSIGLLKGRFRRLQQLNARKLEFNPLYTMSGCILHNFCLKNFDYLDEEFYHPYDFETEEPSNMNDNSEPAAQRKRDWIAQLL